MLPVGLCEWKTTNVHPILTIMFKSVLITLINLRLKSSKYLRTFSLGLKIRPSNKKKGIHLRHMSISKVFSFRKWSFLFTPSDKATKDMTHDLV